MTQADLRQTSPPSRAPNVSVVIPVHENETGLAALLTTLRQACTGLPFVEVLVVDDASHPSLFPVCERFGVRHIALASRRGPAAARNKGAEAACSDYLLFVDSDVLLRPRLVTEMAGELEARHDLTAVAATAAPSPTNPGIVSAFMAAQEFMLVSQCGWPRKAYEYNAFYTRCGLIRASVFEAIGGFDRSLTRPNIEDWEFSSRMRPNDRCLFAERLQCRHAFTNSLRGLARRLISNARLVVNRRLNSKRKVPVSRDLAGRCCALAAMATLPAGAVYTQALLASGVLMCAWLLLIAPLLRIIHTHGERYAVILAPVLHVVATLSLGVGSILGLVDRWLRYRVLDNTAAGSAGTGRLP